MMTQPTPTLTDLADLALSDIDIQSLNRQFQFADPTHIVEWVAEHCQRPIITTNFRPQTAAILHLVTQVMPDIPVLWIDTGYNVQPTVDFADTLSNLLRLNLVVYRPNDVLTPSDNAELQQLMANGIPTVGTPAHDRFTQLAKLHPFQQGLDDLNPDAWITGIRHDQTEFRQSLDVLSHSKQGILKVAPLYYWDKQQQLAYIAKHNLPDEHRYFDPTKAQAGRECGVQLL